MSSFKKIIGQRIAKRRLELGFANQQAFADALEIERATVSRYETGHNTPVGKNLKKILRILKMKESELKSPIQEINVHQSLSELEPRDIARMYLEEKAENDRIKNLLMVTDPLVVAFENSTPEVQVLIRQVLGLPQESQVLSPQSERQHAHSKKPKDSLKSS